MSTMTWTRQSLLETSGTFWSTCTLHAAVKLGIFTLLDGQGLTAQEITAQLGADQRATETLLRALVALGLLVGEGERYLNTEASSRYLSANSNDYIGYILKHHHFLVEQWSHLDQVVLSGQPYRSRANERSEEERESFLLGMFNLARPLAERVAATIDLGQAPSLLDLGGGPGTWALHFCLSRPELHATVYDLPTTRPFAEKTIARYQLERQVTFQAGDYLRDEIEGKYHVAWLSQILHGEGPEQAQAVVNKAVAALHPGGRILIHEFILNDDRVSPLQPALFSLNMLTGTPAGRAYSESDLKDMLIHAGATGIQRIEFDFPCPSAILAGTATGKIRVTRKE